MVSIGFFLDLLIMKTYIKVNIYQIDFCILFERYPLYTFRMATISFTCTCKVRFP
jgi:hypothetical protein